MYPIEIGPTVTPRGYNRCDGDRIVDGMTRGQACERFSRRILLLARRVADRAGQGCDLTIEDLVGYGVLGLLEAFDRFEPEQSVDFSSFASYRILGQMLDAERRASGVTRRQAQISEELAKAAAESRRAVSRAPGHTEIASQLGVSMETYWQMRSASLPPTRDPASAHRPDPRFGITEPAGPRRLMAEDARKALRVAIGALPAKERRVVLLYYAKDCSLAEIGAILEVTPSRVCQVLSSARVKLRKAVGIDVDVDCSSDLDLVLDPPEQRHA